MKFIKVLIIILASQGLALQTIIVSSSIGNGLVFAQDASSSAEQNPTPTQVENFSPSPSPITTSPSPTPTIPSSTIPPTETPVPPTPTPIQEPSPTSSFTLPSPTDILHLLTGTPPPASDSAEKLGTPSATPQPSLAGFTGISGFSARIRLPINIHPLKRRHFKATEKISVTVENTQDNETIVAVYDSNNLKVEVNVQREIINSETIYSILPPVSFVPGKYTLKITDQTGKTETQDFTWGVLAINTNKSMYLPNEEAKLSMAVLDDEGKVICDAKLTLIIQSEKANVDEKLSTDDKTITVNPGCHQTITEEPDYQAKFTLKGIGTYIMTLNATTKNGDYSINDSFNVVESVPFDVERETATRIFPTSIYPVKLHIKANSDFIGQIIETVPDSFDISFLENSEAYQKVERIPIDITDTKNIIKSITPFELPFSGNHPVTQNFGDNISDLNLKQHYSSLGLLGHDGIDFDMPKNTLITAVESGKASIDKNDEYGNTVLIKHDWGVSYYGHLNDILVKDGQDISKGEVIALSGNTGYSTAPHLHFAIKPDDSDVDNGYFGKVNPEPYFTKSLSNANLYKKVITWDISLKKGDTVMIGYLYDAPDISPQFYLLGPLQFLDKGNIVFEEARLWQIAVDYVVSNARATYTDSTAATPNQLRSRTYIGPATTKWSSESSTSQTTSTTITFVVEEASPRRNEHLLGVWEYSGSGTVLRIFRWDGTSWSSEWSTTTANTTLGTYARPFDIAYEKSSGDAIVVYSTAAANTNELAYKVWNGSSWAGPTNYDVAGTTALVCGIELESKPSSEKVAMIYTVSATTNSVNTAVWNGVGWESNPSTPLESGALEPGTACQEKAYDVAWEESSGEILAAWGHDNSSNLFSWSACTGAGACTWAAKSTGGPEEGTVLDLGTQPGTDNIGLSILSNDGNDFGGGYWNGSSWSSTATPDAIAADPDATLGQRSVGVGWLTAGANTRGVLIYADGAATGVDYTLISGGTVSATETQCGNTPGAVLETQIKVIQDPLDAAKFLVLVEDGNSDLYAVRFTLVGTTVSCADTNGDAALNQNLTSATAQPFDMAWEIGVQDNRPKLTQDGYTFENDDGTGTGDGTVQAGTSFTSGKTITSVKKGERITTRIQIKNTGTGALADPLALFYDRNDGIYTKVEATGSAVIDTGNCTDTNYDCLTVDNADTGSYTSTAFDPWGTPWVSYWDTNARLVAAKYVGSGGNCDASYAWQCWNIDSGGVIAGAYTSIAFDKAGNPWISYNDANGDDLRVANFVGSGGTGCSDSSAWNCTEVDTTGTTGQWTSIALGPNNRAWVSYYDASNTQLKVANYVGAGGNCSSAAWNCTAVDNAAGEGEYSSIAFDGVGNAWVSYYDHGDGTCSGGGECGLKVATYVGGTGGNCTSTAWNCTKVDSGVTDIGKYTSIAFDPSGNAAVSYYDATNTQMKVANFVTSGGGCTSAAWNCTAVDNAAGVGEWTSIAYAADGNPWVSYLDHGDGTCSGGGECGLKVARYVGGASGNCTSNNWNCSKVDSAATESGGHTSIAFGPDGRAWVSYRDETNSDLKVANIKRGGEIILSPGLSANDGASITTSHADMTAYDDTTGKGDADCLTATTWNSGKWFESKEGNGLTLPVGSTTSQCTEIAFELDTTRTIANTTYNLVIASKDNWNQSKSLWRGPISIATNGKPLLTTESSTTLRISKDNTPILPNCTDTSWGCYSFDNAVNVNNWLSLVIDNSGAPWIAYFDPGATSLKVAHYVGSSGTGCSTAGNTSWDCITVDNTGTSTGENPALAVDKQGHIWLSYRDVTSTNLKVATNYDHPAMSACTASGWDCTSIADVTFVNDYETSIAIDPAGNPWISFYDFTNTDLYVARYVGVGGNCTHDRTWDCTKVDDAGGDSDSLAFDANGKAWISYYDRGNTNFKVAEFVGAGGNCTSPAWNCTTVDNSGSVGQTTSLAINPVDNKPWSAYWDLTNNLLLIANYVGSGGNCSGSTAWNCQTIQSGQAFASDPSVAFDIYGTPWVQFAHLTGVSASTFKVAKYVGSGGSCTNAAWDCTIVDSSGGRAGEYGSGHAFAFDQSGVPWGVYDDKNVSEIKVAKLHLPPRKDDSKYRLDVGKAPRTESGSCSSNTDKKGYCGITANDSDYDQIAALTSERPLFTFAARNSNNTDTPSATWIGQSTIAPSSKTITMQVYNTSTKAWEALSPYTTDTCAAQGANTDCEITDGPTTSLSNYYEADGSNYWIYFRVWQTENTAVETLKSDVISVTFTGAGGTVTTSMQMRHGNWFDSGTEQGFTF